MPRGDNVQPPTKRGRGQPTKYQERFIEMAEKLCQIGATDVELAAAFNTHVDTIRNWERDHPDFFAAINNGQDYWDNGRVKKSLRERALGYNWQEQSVETTEIECERVDKTGATVRDDKGRKVLVRVPAVKTKTTNRHVPSDPACTFFWLTNRDRVKWQHVRVNRVEGKLDMPAAVTNNYSFEDISSEELEILADTLSKAAERKALAEQANKGRGNSGTA